MYTHKPHKPHKLMPYHTWFPGALKLRYHSSNYVLRWNYD